MEGQSEEERKQEQEAWEQLLKVLQGERNNLEGPAEKEKTSEKPAKTEGQKTSTKKEQPKPDSKKSGENK